MIYFRVTCSSWDIFVWWCGIFLWPVSSVAICPLEVTVTPVLGRADEQGCVKQANVFSCLKDKSDYLYIYAIVHKMCAVCVLLHNCYIWVIIRFFSLVKAIPRKYITNKCACFLVLIPLCKLTFLLDLFFIVLDLTLSSINQHPMFILVQK